MTRGPVRRKELWVKLPPDLCIETLAISAPAAIAERGNVIVKIKMGAMGFIHQGHHAVGVGQIHNGLQVGTDAVIGGVVDKDRLGVRMLTDGIAPAPPWTSLAEMPSRWSISGLT